jgi:hypothetical protein
MRKQWASHHLPNLTNLALAICCSLAGVAVVVAAFKFSFLNWIVDAAGWLVSRFVSIDFHEGEGAFGLLLALFLSWLFASAATFIAFRAAGWLVARSRSR